MFLICWLLHPDPRWRAAIKDLEENEWINQSVDIFNYSFNAILGQLSSQGVLSAIYQLGGICIELYHGFVLGDEFGL